MSKKNKSKKNKTKADLEHKSLEEDLKQVEEGIEEEYKNHPFYTVINFFIGGNNSGKVKSNVEGKPPTY